MTNEENRQARLTKRRLRNRKHQELTPEERRRREVQADINRQLRRWPPRRIAAWSLFAVAALIAAQHVIAHMGVHPLPFSMGWQDLLVGYPMAGIVLILGAFVLEPRRSK